MKLKTLTVIAAGIALAGCSSSSRYSISNDVAPKKPISTSHIENAVPQYEPFSRGGTKTIHCVATAII